MAGSSGVFWRFLLLALASLEGFVVIPGVYWVLKLLASFLGSLNIFLLKEMPWLLGCLLPPLFRVLIVSQSFLVPGPHLSR